MVEIKSILKVYLSVVLFGCSLSSSSQIVHSPYVPQGYKLVYSEEFDAESNKDANWLKHMQGGKDRDWDYFEVSGDGYARLRGIELVNEVLGTSRVTNPSALTKKMWKYGYFECRYKYSESCGINNSFWMIANNSPLDMQVLEIDINEGQLDEAGNRQYTLQGKTAPDSLDRQDAVRPLVLEWSGNGNSSKAAYWYSGSLYGDRNYDLSKNFIVIGFEWTPDVMRFYCDGKLMLETPNTVSKGPNAGNRWLNYPMPIYLSSLYSKNIPHADEHKDGEMVVDYVRVYQNSDSEDIGEAPVEGDNLLKNGDFGSTETNDYAVSHYTGNKQTMYSWVSSLGSVKKGYFEYAPTEKRASPLYMPAQFINHLPDGEYVLSFKAKITGDPKASFGLKISDNKDLAKSNMSIGSISVKQTQCEEWTKFRYYFTLKGNEGATEDRIMFTMTNPDTTAVFALDSVELKSINTANDEYVRDSGFDFGISSGLWSASYSSLYTNGDVVMNRSVENEGDNTFIRTAINKDHNPESVYQTNLSQRTVKEFDNGVYKISINARALGDSTLGKHIYLQLDNAGGSPYYAELVKAYNDIKLSESPLNKYLVFKIDSKEWKTYSADVRLALEEPKTGRLYFRFSDAGCFDLDDVSVRKIDETSGVEINTKYSGIRVNGRTLSVDDDGVNFMQVFDMSGRQIAGSSDRKATISNAGVYIVKLYFDNDIHTSKVVIR